MITRIHRPRPRRPRQIQLRNTHQSLTHRRLHLFITNNVTTRHRPRPTLQPSINLPHPIIIRQRHRLLSSTHQRANPYRILQLRRQYRRTRPRLTLNPRMINQSLNSLNVRLPRPSIRSRNYRRRSHSVHHGTRSHSRQPPTVLNTNVRRNTRRKNRHKSTRRRKRRIRPRQCNHRTNRNRRQRPTRTAQIRMTSSTNSTNRRNGPTHHFNRRRTLMRRLTQLRHRRRNQHRNNQATRTNSPPRRPISRRTQNRTRRHLRRSRTRNQTTNSHNHQSRPKVHRTTVKQRPINNNNVRMTNQITRRSTRIQVSRRRRTLSNRRRHNRLRHLNTMQQTAKIDYSQQEQRI